MLVAQPAVPLRPRAERASASGASSAVREAFRSALGAACVACGTLGGAIAGAIAGATSERGIVRGAVRGAYAGAFTLLETLDLGWDFAAAAGAAAGDGTAGGRARAGESYAVLTDERAGVVRAVAMPLTFTHAMNFTQVLRMVTSGECSRGAAASDVTKLPVREFRDEDATTQAATCAVCLCAFVGGETVKTLPNCSHEFHESCIDPWLLRRDCCPMCRRRASIDRDSSSESDFHA